LCGEEVDRRELGRGGKVQEAEHAREVNRWVEGRERQGLKLSK
jgi:hypothetical protein